MGNVYYSPDYVSAKHAFDTTRKSAEIAKALEDKGILTSEPNYTNQEIDTVIAAAVDNGYINDLREGPNSRWTNQAESNGFEWCDNMYNMARAHTNGTVSAAVDALTSGGIHGSLSSGAHHADHEGGYGFCTLNSLAIAANHLIKRFPSRCSKILIIDLDDHNGGGTVRQLRHLGIDDVVHQVDISTNRFDYYENDEHHHLHVAENEQDYFLLLDELLMHPSLDQDNYDIVFYNAGTDPSPGFLDQTELKLRDELVFKRLSRLGIPCAYILAGGYTLGQTMEELVQAHVNTVEMALQYDIVAV